MTSARLFHHVLFNMGDMHLVLPVLNLSTLNAGIYVILMMFSLNMVGGPWDFSVSPRPLGFGFWGLGPGLDNYDAPPVQISDWEVTSISKQWWGWGIDHNTDREGILGTWSKLAVSSYMISSKGGTRMIMKWGRIILSQDDNKLLWCGGRRIITGATVGHYVVNDDFRIWTKVRWKMSMRTISNLEFRGQRLALTHQ